MSEINNVTSIDTAYEKLLNNQLTEEDIAEISEVLGDDDPDMIAAKELAANSTKLDEAFVGESYLNEDGHPIMTEELNMDNIPSFKDLLDGKDLTLPDISTIDCMNTIGQGYITSFFAIDNTEEALLNHGITKEVVDDMWELADRFKLSVKTGKKFSYYNALPEPIKPLVIKFQGTNGIKYGGSNQDKAARNYVASCLIQHFADTEYNNILALDLEQSIAKTQKELEEIQNKGAKELAESPEWANGSWKMYIKELPEMAAKAEALGWEKEAKTYKEVIAAYQETCTFKMLVDDIKSGLKVRHIDLERFDKYCESFNSKYENTEYTINDVMQAYDALCRSGHFNEEAAVYEKFVAYFIAYCDKHKLSVDDIVDHTYMYYFIKNILLMDCYNPNDPEDLQFHKSYLRCVQNALNVVKSTMDLSSKNDIDVE